MEPILVIDAVVAHIKMVLPKLSEYVFDTLIPGNVRVDDHRCVVVALFDTHDTTNGQGDRLLTHVSLLIKVVGQEETYTPLLKQLDTVDQALTSMEAPGHVFGYTRTRAYLDTTVEGGVQYRHVGGVYEFQIHKSRQTP